MRGVKDEHWLMQVNGDCLECGHQFDTLHNARKHCAETGHLVSCEKVIEYTFTKEEVGNGTGT